MSEGQGVINNYYGKKLSKNYYKSNIFEKKSNGIFFHRWLSTHKIAISHVKIYPN